MNEGDWGPSMALLRIRLGPAIQLFNMSRGVWEALQGMMGYGLTGSLGRGRGFLVLFVCVSNKYVISYKPQFMET